MLKMITHGIMFGCVCVWLCVCVYVCMCVCGYVVWLGVCTDVYFASLIITLSLEGTFRDHISRNLETIPELVSICL